MTDDLLALARGEANIRDNYPGGLPELTKERVKMNEVTCPVCQLEWIPNEVQELRERVAELEALAVVGGGAIAHLPDPSDGECAIFLTIPDRGPFDLRRSESGWTLTEIVGDSVDWNVYQWNAATWQECLRQAGVLGEARDEPR